MSVFKGIGGSKSMLISFFFCGGEIVRKCFQFISGFKSVLIVCGIRGSFLTLGVKPAQ